MENPEAERAVVSDDVGSLRPMRLSDIARISRLEQRCFSTPWSSSFFHRCLKRGCRGWVVEIGGRIEGYAMVAHASGIAHLMNLCVAPAHRRRGLGRRLLRHLVAEARRARTMAIILEVRESNRRALELYYSEGFMDVGKREAYYPAPDGREDARVLCLPL